MKKLLCLCFCVLLLCGAMPVTAYAITENYCDVFSDGVTSLWIVDYYAAGDASTMMVFSIEDAQEFAYDRTVLNEGTYDQIVTYKIPEEAFENAVRKHFYVESMDIFKRDLNGGDWWYSSSYNAEEQCYIIKEEGTGGFGSPTAYHFVGYTVADGLYTVYGYQVFRAYEKPDDAIEGVDYIMHMGRPALIEQAHKCVLKFNGENHQIYSWENIDSIPDAADMVTPLSPGDTDGDGKVNIRDLGLLQQHLNGWDVYIHTSACDVNGDGKANVRDLGLLQQHLNGWDVELI